FIGNRIVRTLLQQGKTDLILVDAPSYLHTRACAKGMDGIPFIDRAELFDRLPGLAGVDVVLHLGACTDTGQTDEAYMEKWNTGYTQQLWRWCAEKQIPLVYASSAATYGRGEHGYSDDHALIAGLQPLNLYGRSKHDFDLWALKESRTPPAWHGLKFFNVYGPGENHKDRMASTIYHGFHEIQKTGKMTLFKSHRDGIPDGQQKRDFVFVDDAVRLCLFCLERKPASGIYNCGTGEARSFLDLAHALFQALRLEPKIEWVPTPERFRSGYQYFTQADMSKARKAGYEAAFTSLEEGVAHYARWLCGAPGV
ncbi:MAG: ADP-glyceromanno-heptose 6-epimerase, partial [Nitrospirota bacterium]